MKLKLWQVDAFAERPFAGNPAAVVPLEGWLSDAKLQAIANENNLAETAFFVARGGGSYDLRWFTPAMEIPLCGHATLASAHALWQRGDLLVTEEAAFHTLSGILKARRAGDLIEMDFPAITTEAAELPKEVGEALGNVAIR